MLRSNCTQIVVECDECRTLKEFTGISDGDALDEATRNGWLLSSVSGISFHLCDECLSHSEDFMKQAYTNEKFEAKKRAERWAG